MVALALRAVAPCGADAEASASAWDAILWSQTITVLPLTERVAVEISAWTGTPAARHSLWEARAMNCPIVTRQPDLYAPGVVEIVQV